MDKEITAGPNNTGSPGEASYIGPKPWAEITDTEKIERQREIIKSTQRDIQRMREDINYLKEMITDHRHDAHTGMPTSPVRGYPQRQYLEYKTVASSVNLYF